MKFRFFLTFQYFWPISTIFLNNTFISAFFHINTNCQFHGEQGRRLRSGTLELIAHSHESHQVGWSQDCYLRHDLVEVARFPYFPLIVPLWRHPNKMYNVLNGEKRLQHRCSPNRTNCCPIRIGISNTDNSHPTY